MRNHCHDPRRWAYRRKAIIRNLRLPAMIARITCHKKMSRGSRSKLEGRSGRSQIFLELDGFSYQTALRTGLQRIGSSTVRYPFHREKKSFRVSGTDACDRGIYLRKACENEGASQSGPQRERTGILMQWPDFGHIAEHVTKPRYLLSKYVSISKPRSQCVGRRLEIF